jgi:glycosyltransferase involved in cell wall biosynthesis
MAELVAAYTEADIFLNPSVEETFGMTAMEARCCGTEAIVYKDTACEEIVNQFGGIAVPKGAQYLYEAVKSMTEEEAL